MLDVSEVIVDPELAAQSYTVVRSSGSFVKGRWVATTTEIEIFGAVTVSSARDLNMVPEGDRIKGAMTFHSTSELFVTDVGEGVISDKALWNGEYYKFVNVLPFKDFGFWKAVGVRIKGS